MEYGVVPTHADPSKDSTAQYHYTFAGWSPEVTAVTSEASYRATFSAELRSYPVVFKDWDGTQIGETQNVAYGSAAVAPANPSRTGYTFAGWDKDFSSITGATTVTATYTLNQFTVKFVNDDGSVLQTETLDYGAMPAYKGVTPVKASTAQFHPFCLIKSYMIHLIY